MLDVSQPNQLIIVAGMGKPTRNELLAECERSFRKEKAGRDENIHSRGD
jgi:hypothetical protein